MDYLLGIGLVFGIVVGLVHGNYVFRHTLAEPGARGIRATLRAWYYALWTVLLWTLLGTYVLVMWVVSLVAYGASRLVLRLAASR